MRLIALVLLVVAAAVAVVALRDDGGDAAPPPRAHADRPARAAPRERPTPVARCPAGAGDCVAVHGRALYVEHVDPDGDGDLHVVIAGGGVTLPGVTSIDVAEDLRPRHDPRIGDLVAAAGPVQRGHLGQAQVHALVFAAQR